MAPPLVLIYRDDRFLLITSGTYRTSVALGTPLAVAGKEESEIHHTIAELMILANSYVAEKIHSTFPSCSLVRVHAPPEASKLSAFDGVAAKVGASSSEGLLCVVPVEKVQYVIFREGAV